MRTIPIPKLTVDLLVEMQAKATEGNPYVLISASRLRAIAASKQAGEWKEGRAMLNNVNRDWHRLAKLAEVSDATPHDLRRSAITNWARRLPIHVTQELAGHENITTTRKYYLSITEADKENAREAAQDAIQPVVVKARRGPADSACLETRWQRAVGRVSSGLCPMCFSDATVKPKRARQGRTRLSVASWGREPDGDPP